MNKKLILTAIVFGLVSIALGAFGAHALKKVLGIEQLASFEVGVRYMMYHAFFLFFIGNTSMLTFGQKKIIYTLTFLGILMFSFSIFLLTTSVITGVNFKFLGPITPLGGVVLLFAWALTFYYVSIKKE